MSKIRCTVCVGTGEVYSETEKAWGKCWVCDGLGEVDDTPADWSYYEDEWYDDDDYEEDRGIAETSYVSQLHKAKNGHLVIVETRGYCKWGQDWGETVGQWETEYIRLNQALPLYRKAAIHKGKSMKPGTTIDFYAGAVRLVRPVRLTPAFRAMSCNRAFTYFRL